MRHYRKRSHYKSSAVMLGTLLYLMRKYMTHPFLCCLPSPERLVGAVWASGGGSVSGQPGLRQRPTLHAQPRTSREPLSVPLPEPKLLAGPRLQQPALHSALSGGCPLSPFNLHQHLPHHTLLLLPLPPLHEQPRHRSGDQDGDGGGGRRPRQPNPRRRNSSLLG